MASSLSSHFTSNRQHLLDLQWYEIRDMFLGFNRVDRNIPLALERAAACEHPDARWLAGVFAGKEVSSEEEATAALRAYAQDPRAMCFAAVMT
jgi:hypothetical protein